MSTPTTTPTPISSPAPLQPLLPLILPYLTSALRNLARLIITLPKYTANFLTYAPWSILISPLAYLFAPITTFIYILLSLTVYAPYHVILWLLETLFPLYVLCGVACITGGILGLGGRMASLSIVRIVSEEYANARGLGYPNDMMKSGDEDILERRAKRRRLDKKERDGRVKFEPS